MFITTIVIFFVSLAADMLIGGDRGSGRWKSASGRLVGDPPKSRRGDCGGGVLGLLMDQGVQRTPKETPRETIPWP